MLRDFTPGAAPFPHADVFGARLSQSPAELAGLATFLTARASLRRQHDLAPQWPA